MKEFLLASLFYFPVSSVEIASTKYTLSTCQVCREANPVYSPTLKLGLSGGMTLLDSKVKSKKQKKIMRIMWIASNIVYTSINIYHVKKYGDRRLRNGS